MIDVTLVDPDLADRGTQVRRGLAMLVVVAVVSALLVAAGRGSFADTVEVRARLADAGGALVPGSDVKVDGVVVGRVTGLEGRQGDVTVGLRLKADQAKGLPAAVKARVMPATVFGTTYVDLVRPRRATADGDTLQAGAVVPQDRSTETVELQDALDSTERLLTAVRPSQLSTTLGALAQALDGRGDDVGQMVEDLDAYLARLGPRVPRLRQDLQLLSRNLTTLADVAPEALDAVRDALVTSRTIVERRRDLSTLIGGSADLVDEAERAAASLEDRFVRAVSQSTIVVGALFQRRAGLAASFTSFTAFAAKQASTFSDGPWMSTNVFIKTGDDAPYTAADCPRYGSLRGPRCGGGTAGGNGSSATADPDESVVREVRKVLESLRAAQDGGGVGSLLARPYLDEEDDR